MTIFYFLSILFWIVWRSAVTLTLLPKSTTTSSSLVSLSTFPTKPPDVHNFVAFFQTARAFPYAL